MFVVKRQHQHDPIETGSLVGTVRTIFRYTGGSGTGEIECAPLLASVVWSSHFKYVLSVSRSSCVVLVLLRATRFAEHVCVCFE